MQFVIFCFTCSDLPTFYEIKAEDLPPFGKKRKRRFSCLENIGLFYLPVTQNEPIFSVLTSPNSTDIAKLVVNNNTLISVYVCYLLLEGAPCQHGFMSGSKQ